MRFQLNFKSGKPVYLQLVDQVKAAAASGALRAGEPLPSIRPLAEELRVNRNTVAKAYAELESQGVDRDARRQGLLRSRQQLAVQERRAPEAPDAKRSTTPSCRRTTCRWQERVPARWPKNDSTHSNRSERAPRM